MSDIDDIRARIRNAPESVDAPLIRRLHEMPQVAYVRTRWFPGCLDVTIGLREWTWDATCLPGAAVDVFAREHIDRFSVTHRFEPPELRRP